MKLIIGFSRARSWWALGSKSIQIAEKRPYSHVYVRYESPLTGVNMITQASHGSVNQQNFDIFIQKNIVVKEYEFDIDKEKFKILKTYIDQKLGTPYSQIQIVYLSLKKLFRIKIDKNNGDSEFICSEFATRILEVLEILYTSEHDLITPSDVETLILKK